MLVALPLLRAGAVKGAVATIVVIVDAPFALLSGSVLFDAQWNFLQARNCFFPVLQGR